MKTKFTVSMNQPLLLKIFLDESLILKYFKKVKKPNNKSCDYVCYFEQLTKKKKKDIT